MKILKKTLLIFLVAAIALSFMAPISRAGSALDRATKFIQRGSASAGDASEAVEEMSNQMLPIINLLVNIGAGVMVAVVTFMGIKYFTSTPDAQAKLKQQLIGVCVAGVVIFGAVGIWKMTLNIASEFDKTQ
jgi:hypothetical protein